MLKTAKDHTCSGAVVKEWCLYVGDYSAAIRLCCWATQLWTFSCR